MEKVKIRKGESIMDGKAWAVEFADSRKATAWCDKVDCELLAQAYKTMNEIEVELKPYKSKAGKEGLNIVAIANYEGIVKEVPRTEPLQTIYDAKQGNASANGQYQKPKAYPAGDPTKYPHPMDVRQEAEMPKPEDFGEADITSINAKSSVKIKKNSKGIGWEIKVVTGEIDLIHSLGVAAIVTHQELGLVFPDEE